jgi:hypothetical protein
MPQGPACILLALLDQNPRTVEEDLGIKWSQPKADGNAAVQINR